jgi:hypothetical protein
MTDVWLTAALWLGLALLATMLSIWLRVATALSGDRGWNGSPTDHRRRGGNRGSRST